MARASARLGGRRTSMSNEIPSADGDSIPRAFLASRGERLSRLLDQVVPGLADWCVLDLLDEDGALARLAVRASEALPGGLAAALAREDRLDLNTQRGPARAF